MYSGPRLSSSRPRCTVSLKAKIETITGAKIDDHLKWRAEVVQEGDKARPDLEACTANKTPVVKTEAKLALFSAKTSFGPTRLTCTDVRRGRRRLGVVPRQRIEEATEVVTEAFKVSGAPHGDRVNTPVLR